MLIISVRTAISVRYTQSSLTVLYAPALNSNRSCRRLVLITLLIVVIGLSDLDTASSMHIGEYWAEETVEAASKSTTCEGSVMLGLHPVQFRAGAALVALRRGTCRRTCLR